MARRIDLDEPKTVEVVVESVPVPDFDGKTAHAQLRLHIDSLRNIVGVEPIGSRFRSYGRFRDDGMYWQLVFQYPIGNAQGEEYAARLLPVAIAS